MGGSAPLCVLLLCVWGGFVCCVRCVRLVCHVHFVYGVLCMRLKWKGTVSMFLYFLFAVGYGVGLVLGLASSLLCFCCFAFCCCLFRYSHFSCFDPSFYFVRAALFCWLLSASCWPLLLRSLFFFLFFFLLFAFARCFRLLLFLFIFASIFFFCI